ncbi:MAPEG family protein [Sulfitobacter guttiformis]|uniref:Glutathione S-transferase n=1 Tax=Sulfitobacter guttiformis TaxID=74349 RepID=A0A420DNK9_9RHOB|nr:MAPEG family protein [Sulfitobacter guttiformis]KIN73106.1 Relative of glutathione S-transferase [Sulfitobacter guttiformis KCTC 32187]RKE95790.1 hypothetical protein C8N30_0329 [Sulfitobacter guttiformis]
MLIITPIYAGLLALVFAVLSALVVRQRVTLSKAADKTDEATLQTAVRVQANFAEYVPLAVILMICAELLGAPSVAVHVMGISLLAGRLCHAIGMSATPQIGVLRASGFLLTFFMLVLSALAVLVHALL